MKVLMVDNNQIVLEVMKILISKYGHKPIVTSSYNTVLPIINKDKPDIIILDATLNDEDGRVVCKQLKENPETKDICIILFSTYSYKLRDFKSYNADGILHNPFEASDLQNVLHLGENKLKSNTA